MTRVPVSAPRRSASASSSGVGSERRSPGEQLGRKPRLGDEGRFDLRVDFAAHREREQRAGDGQRDQRGRERGEKQLGLEGPSVTGRSTSL